MVALAAPLGLGAVLLLKWRELRAGAILSAAMPLLLMVGLFLGYNRALTGDEMITPFERWSRTDRIGFGPEMGLEYWPPYDRGHNLMNASKNTYMNVDAIGINLVGWGQGTLVLMVAALFVHRRRGVAVLAWAAIGVLAFAYFFYHAAGTLAGQARYWSESMAFMFLLVTLGLGAARAAIAAGFHRFGWAFADARAKAAVWMAALAMTVYAGTLAHRDLIAECSGLFWGQGPTLRNAVADEKLDHAIVFIPTDYYRTSKMVIDNFAIGAAMNTPTLDGPVLYARDWGRDQDQVLLRAYPDRKAYRFDPKASAPPYLIPVAPPTTAP